MDVNESMNFEYSDTQGEIRSGVQRLCAEFGPEYWPRSPSTRLACPAPTDPSTTEEADMANLAQIAAAPVPHAAATASLAEFACTARVDDLAMRRAASVLLDTMATTLAGGREPPVQALATTLEPAPGGIPSFWTADRYRPEDAALLFGMASHILDGSYRVPGCWLAWGVAGGFDELLM